MRKKTVRDIDVNGKRVLVRVDYNVPLDAGKILDDSRIRATLPTISYLREQQAKLILMSHLGRPKGRRDEALSLRPVAKRLGELLGGEASLRRPGVDHGDTPSPESGASLREARVQMTDCCVGAEVQRAAHSLGEGEILLLENLRFHPEEEANDREYAKALASLGEVYVNDAFGTAHRAHASTEGVARLLPAVAGFLMEKEIEFLSRAVENPERPYAAIIGGAKISTKMAVLEHLLSKVDKLLVGGGMANTFLKAEGFNVGESLVEDDYLEQAKNVMRHAEEKGVRLLLPADVIVAERSAADSPARRVSVKDVPEGWRIMDVGETTIDVFARALQDCRMVVWNGPMGVIEMAPFAHGSHRLAGVIANLGEATTIIGGGETAAVVEQVGLASRFSHVSTGGGASLEFLEGKELPGVAALMDA
ncbi:MAG: phosphoglycerate kinase [Chloroflexi bacterium]|nr:MAG: phosphoglycerate kinase [Chloroflexota bacterium]